LYYKELRAFCLFSPSPRHGDRRFLTLRPTGALPVKFQKNFITDRIYTTQIKKNPVFLKKIQQLTGSLQ
jgi:hypothetical protein